VAPVDRGTGKVLEMKPPKPDPMRAVLIGPESTGKTWLAQDLASRYQVCWSREYARQFVESHPRPVVYGDVEVIGRGQRACEDQALARACHAGAILVIHDTDLVSTVVYSRHYFGDCPVSIESAAANRLANLYLLLRPDVPWVADGHQRAECESRDELFARFRETLAALRANVVEIGGEWAARRRSAIEAIEAILASPIRKQAEHR
jgi:NadR type nicotinamide-nucleotide adenylyltransferase